MTFLYLNFLFSILTLMQTAATSKNNDDIKIEIPNLIKVYKNGTVERFQQSPLVPPSLDDDDSVSSKDVIISYDPKIMARLYRPRYFSVKYPMPILVYFHGGGFFLESAFSQLYHHRLSSLVDGLHVQVIIVSVEYRLAPEHSLPAAYEDCWEALLWAANCSLKNINAERWLLEYGDFGKIFIAGDGAGSNIVHNVALRSGLKHWPSKVVIRGAIYAHPYFWGTTPIGSEPVSKSERAMQDLRWKLVYPSAPGGLDSPMINPLANGAPSLDGLGCSKILIFVAGNDSLRDRGVWFYEGVNHSEWKGELYLFEQEGEGPAYHIYNPESDRAKKMNELIASFILRGIQRDELMVGKSNTVCETCRVLRFLVLFLLFNLWFRE